MTDERGDHVEKPEHDLPAFPSVGGRDPGAEPASASHAPLFTSADDHTTATSSAADSVVVTQPVKSGPAGSSRLRWAVAGIATLLVLAVVGGVLLLAGPRAGTPSVVEYYVPADTAAYLDMRLDLPGDQRANLAAFMAHFPGFADPAAFQQKLDEMLDQALKSADSGLEWQRDVAPWFGGQVGVFAQTLATSEGTPPSIVVALTVKDRAALEAFIADRLADHKVDTTEHQGSQIQTFTDDPGGQRVSLAVTDELVLVGTRIEDVQAALDAKAGARPSLAQDQFFLQQLGALHADRIATGYYDMGRVMDSLQTGAGGNPVDVFGTECLTGLQSAARVKYVLEARAEEDHLAITTRSQAPTGGNLPPLPANKPNSLAAAMPGDAIAYAEFRQVGANARAVIAGFLECLSEMPDSQGAFDPSQLEQFLGVEPQDYLDFVDDVGVAVTMANDLPGGGLVATVDDEAVASQRVDRLVTTLRALAAFGDDGAITVEETEHNGVTITEISFPNPIPDMDLSSISVAVANGRLYLGLGDFVIGAIDRQQQDSLAATDGFESAVAAGGTSNAGIVYVDMTRARELVESTIPEAERAEYEAEGKPFIEPLTSVSIVNRVDNGILVSHIFVYVE